MAANPTEELQRYCRPPEHAEGLSGSFAVAQGWATRNDVTVEAGVEDVASLPAPGGGGDPCVHVAES